MQTDPETKDTLTTETPTQTATPPAEPPPEELTEEQFQEEAEKFGSQMVDSLWGNGKKAEKKDEPTTEPAAAPVSTEEPGEPAPAAEPDPKPEPEPEPAAGLDSTAEPAPAPDPAPIDEDQIVDRVAARLAEKPVSEQPTEDPLASYSPEDRRYLVVADFLARNNPKYQGRNLTKEVTDFWKREQEYISKWERENPGEQFESKDHEGWYSKNSPKIPDEDFDEAKFEVRAQAIREEAKQEALKEVMPHLEQIRVKEEVARIQPVVQQAVMDAELNMVLEAAPEFKQFLEDGKITKGAAEKMKQHDPEMFDVLAEQSAELKVVIKELQFKDKLGNRYQIDPNRAVQVGDKVVYPWAEIRDTGLQIEQRTSALPEKERVRDGRRFITRSDLSRRVQEVEQSNLPENEKTSRINRLFDTHWFVDTEEIRKELVNKNAGRAKKVIDLVNNRLKRLGVNPANPRETTPAATPAKTTIRTASPPPASPGSVSDNVDTQKRTPDTSEDLGKQIDKSFFG